LLEAIETCTQMRRSHSTILIAGAASGGFGGRLVGGVVD
jgi:hypothetical protein